MGDCSRTIGYSSAFLDEHRYINVEDRYWYLDVYEDWTRKLLRLGITPKAKGRDERFAIQFSGFGSQGDGACFTGYVKAEDMRRFLRIHKLRDRYRPAYTLVSTPDYSDTLYVWIHENGSRYCHEHSVDIDIEVNDESPYDPDDEVRYAMWESIIVAYNALHIDMLLDIERILRGYMKQIYRDLEQEYFYLTSDEAVAETLECNDIKEEEDAETQ